MAETKGLYGSGLRWRSTHVDAIDRRPRFDLAVVVVDSCTGMPGTRMLALGLAQEHKPVLILGPPEAVDETAQIDGALIVSAPAAHPADNLMLLSHAVLAPAHATALADLDWADVLSVMAQGSHAVLASGRGREPELALADLDGDLDGSAGWDLYGAVGVVGGCGFRWFHEMVEQVRARMRGDATLAVGLTEFNEFGTGTFSAFLAITRPSNGRGVR